MKSDKQQLLVITSYPEEGEIHGQKVVGGATYTKNTLLALKKEYPELEITVLAEQLPKNVIPDSDRGSMDSLPQLADRGNDKTYTENGITVHRVWKRNSLTSFFSLLNPLLTSYSSTKTILLELEFSMFGGMIHLLPLPFFLFFMKVLGKRVIVVLHQVVLDFNTITGHINMKENSFKVKVFNTLINLFYKAIIMCSANIIVFEEIFRKNLSKVIRTKQAKVIPHAVENFVSQTSPETARHRLKISEHSCVLLVFGFLAWYKGTDWIVNVFKSYEKELPQNTLLLIAGGPNPNHKDKAFYNDYVHAIEAYSSRNVRVTGFVPEDEISLYYNAADTVVFPYRTLMSASGPLSMAFSFGRPTLLSSTLAPILETHDIKEIQNSLQLANKDFVFKDENEFIEQIKHLRTSRFFQSKLTRFSKEIAKARNWQIIAERYYEELFEK